MKNAGKIIARSGNQTLLKLRQSYLDRWLAYYIEEPVHDFIRWLFRIPKNPLTTVNDINRDDQRVGLDYSATGPTLYVKIAVAICAFWGFGIWLLIGAMGLCIGVGVFKYIEYLARNLGWVGICVLLFVSTGFIGIGWRTSWRHIKTWRLEKTWSLPMRCDIAVFFFYVRFIFKPTATWREIFPDKDVFF